MDTLYELLKEAQEGQERSTLALLERFEPLMKKYAKMLGYEDAMQDLTLAFLNVIINMTLKEKYCSDGQIINYFSKAIYHEYIRLAKAFYRHESEIAFDENIKTEVEEKIVETDFHDGMDVLNVLTERQKQVVYLLYFCDFSAKEIAAILGVSRQAINKTKNNALEILRKYI